VRVAVRTPIFLCTVAQAVLDYVWLRLRFGENLSARRRAEWLHRWCRKGLPRLNIRFTTQGNPPANGLLVANHLSYLDIIILSARAPCVFVAKREIEGWPVFGFMSRMAGTFFLARARRAEPHSAQSKMKKLLGEGLPGFFFPEGTSPDGTAVLPF